MQAIAWSRRSSLQWLTRLLRTRDVIDTEPSNGNVWKMLLGAVNKWFDGDPVHTSPVSITSPLNSPVHTTNGFANDQYRTPP